MHTIESVSVKALAFRVLQELTSRRIQASVCPTRDTSAGQPAERPNSPLLERQSTSQIALCGSPHCGGCYDAGDGRKIHPPKCGEDYLGWFKRWEGKGCRMQ
jgi:hypothetical protein